LALVKAPYAQRPSLPERQALQTHLVSSHGMRCPSCSSTTSTSSVTTSSALPNRIVATVAQAAAQHIDRYRSRDSTSAMSGTANDCELSAAAAARPPMPSSADPSGFGGDNFRWATSQPHLAGTSSVVETEGEGGDSGGLEHVLPGRDGKVVTTGSSRAFPRQNTQTESGMALPCSAALVGHNVQSHLRTIEPDRCQPVADVLGEMITDPLEAPPQFRCPISQELMEDPVTTADGHTYERREIFRWLCLHNTSPLTGAPLPNKSLTPAISLRQLIATFRVEHPDLVNGLGQERVEPSLNMRALASD